MPSPTKKETQKEAIMRILGVSSAEADQILADDKEVDRGKKHDWDLSDAEHKKPKEPIKRERKANPTKGGIIASLAEFFTQNETISAQNVAITNAERQISFEIGDQKYEITLIAKRKPKN